MTQNGETNDYRASDHVRAIYRHIGENTIDAIIVNNGEITDKTLLQTYAKENSHIVAFDEQTLRDFGLHVIAENLVDHSTNMIRHNTKLLASLLYEMALYNIGSRG